LPDTVGGAVLAGGPLTAQVYGVAAALAPDASVAVTRKVCWPGVSPVYDWPLALAHGTGAALSS
jgi:hypothetical protein